MTNDAEIIAREGARGGGRESSDDDGWNQDDCFSAPATGHRAPGGIGLSGRLECLRPKPHSRARAVFGRRR
jgi:hypothetical protein